MTYPQYLLISTDSSLRRLYHRKLQDVECELHTARSIADALGFLSIIRPDAIILSSPLPEFEVFTFIEMKKKHKEWQDTPLVVVGYTHIRHKFPKETTFAETIDEAVSVLSQISATLGA